MFQLLPTNATESRRSFLASLALHAIPPLLLLIPASRPSRTSGNSSGSKPPLPHSPDPNAAKAPSTNSPIHTGIILWPEAVAAKPLLVPPPPDPTRFSRKLASTPQLDLPFSGVYHLFQFPDPAPPRNSPVFRGAPADYKFRSSDHSPLRVEARQALPGPISLSSIAAIEVSLDHIDRNRADVALELVAIDTSSIPSVRRSLGTRYLPFGTVEQALRFPIPRDLHGPTNELLLRFQLGPFSADTAPRIRLNKFRFITRR